MDVQTYFFRRSNMNALGKPRSWTDHLLWHHACHTVDLFQYQTGEAASEAFGVARAEACRAWHRHGHEHWPEDALRRHLHAVALVQQQRAARNLFPLYLRRTGTYIARYDDLFDGYDKPVDLSGVAVSNNGIELIDREFFSAIKEGREPNGSVAQCLSAMQTLHRLEQQLQGD